MASDYTYNLKGEKDISIISHSQNKLRFTIGLGILSNGIKLPPLIIFKYEYPFKKNNLTEN